MNILEPPMHMAGKPEPPATLPPGSPPSDALPLTPEKARVAWAHCRGLLRAWMPLTGLSPEQIDEAMVLTDCMAEKGWLSVVDVGNPFDAAAEQAAVAACPR